MPRPTFDHNTCIGIRPGKKKGQFFLQTYVKEQNSKGEARWVAGEKVDTLHPHYPSMEAAMQAANVHARHMRCCIIPGCRHNQLCDHPVRGRTSGQQPDFSFRLGAAAGQVYLR